MSTDSDHNHYWASKEAKKVVEVALHKGNLWYNNMHYNGYLYKLRDMWMSYYGANFASMASTHKITFAGEQGELAQISINHLHNLCNHILTMVTSNRPVMQARASNKDYKSLVQTKLANQLLDYYMREKRLEKYLHDATEMAIVLASGYVKMAWNATSGEIYDYTEDGAPIYEGDVEFTNLSPFDVIFDGSKETAKDHDWIIVRTFKNRFDLTAKYPELKDKIKAIPSKSELYNFKFEASLSDETDDIAVYELYHKKTESMPQGRYMFFCDTDVVFEDTPMPYRQIPVFRISPAIIMGTPYGYTSMFDILPIQDAIDSLYSTILTNQYAFGVQNIYIPRGADVSMKAMEGGLNIIEGNANAGKPEPMNLTQTPPEIFNFLKMLETAQETISGVNSVARGNPEASLKSGTALALVQSMALQYISGLQQQYVQLVEDVGTALIMMLKDFAAVPRVAMIAGRDNKSYVSTEFSGDDLSQVNRIIVDVGNPLAQCLKKGTPILMFDGSTKLVEDIQIGEQVMGPDSNPRTVKNVNIGEEMMYDISSINENLNVAYGCNASHILTLRYCSDDPRYNAKKGDVLDITVKDYLKLPKRQQRILMGFRTPIEYSEKSLSIPPYILGAWLGDGHESTTCLTSADAELVSAWVEYADSINMEVRVRHQKDNNSSLYFITSEEQNGSSERNKMMNCLRSLDLIDNKHIPKEYLTSSRQQRLQLLAGLLDTDGTLVGNETFVFTQKRKNVAADVANLARSLGFKTTQVSYMTSENSFAKEPTEMQKITISGNTWEIPTKLKRKQAEKKEKSRNWLNYGIQVEEAGFGTYYGFTLEEEPHFVLGDYTVTHNTTAGKVQMAENLIQYGVITSPKEYLMVLQTGRLDLMTGDEEREYLLINAENESLAEGKPVIAMDIDQHTEHIKQHRAVLADPTLRHDPKFRQDVLNHISQHINLLRTVDPSLLAILGEHPLPPVNGTPPNPQNPNQAINISGGAPGNSAPMQGPPQGPQAPGLPQLPHPPGQFANLPISMPPTGYPAMMPKG